jgi:hypothetical protein
MVETYLAATDHSGEVSDGPPCPRRSTYILQAGITRMTATQRSDRRSGRKELHKTGTIQAGVGHRELSWL